VIGFPVLVQVVWDWETVEVSNAAVLGNQILQRIWEVNVG
jgi:hypothetical protein